MQITARQNKLTITGKEKDVNKTVDIVNRMQKQLQKGHSLTSEDVIGLIRRRGMDQPLENVEAITVYSHGKVVEPSTKGQQKYIKTMLANDLTFCIGPAGTGKTYLAVAIAISMLKKRQIRRIVLAQSGRGGWRETRFFAG